MKIAYTSWTWIHSSDPEIAKMELEQSFRELKHIGYDYVENFAFISDFYKENPKELVEMTKKVGVDLVNLYGHFNFDIENSVAIGKSQIDFLAECGIPYFNCQNGGFGDGGPIERPSDYKMLDITCEIANQLGKYGKEKGVTLCFHPHFGTCVCSQSDIDYFAAHTNPEYVYFCFDTAHTTIGGMDPVALIHQYGKRIAYMHLKDVDTYALSKATPEEKMNTFRELGFGTVNFPAVKAALEEEGYDGVLCVELDGPTICNYHAATTSREYIRCALKL
ncbi:MAG: hypothetical protein E7326_08195 [Clostridiales bacterium]|nr:hypothetical protein [Clostridiales bacterium]